MVDFIQDLGFREVMENESWTTPALVSKKNEQIFHSCLHGYFSESLLNPIRGIPETHRFQLG